MVVSKNTAADTDDTTAVAVASTHSGATDTTTTSTSTTTTISSTSSNDNNTGNTSTSNTSSSAVSSTSNSSTTNSNSRQQASVVKDKESISSSKSSDNPPVETSKASTNDQSNKSSTDTGNKGKAEVKPSSVSASGPKQQHSEESESMNSCKSQKNSFSVVQAKTVHEEVKVNYNSNSTVAPTNKSTIKPLATTNTSTPATNVTASTTVTTASLTAGSRSGPSTSASQSGGTQMTINDTVSGDISISSSANDSGTYLAQDSRGQLGLTNNTNSSSHNNNDINNHNNITNKDQHVSRGSNAKTSDGNPQHHNSYQHNQHNKSSHQHHHHHYHNIQHHQSHQQHQNHSHHHNNEQLSKTNLYIKGLNADTSDSDLFSLCNRFGSIVSTKAILDKNTNKCKGYGFVDFETPAAAETAVVELQKQGILVHMARQQEADPTNLYIANLPQLMTESELENLLRPFGQVVSTRILINANRQPRGVGFARMETKEQCDSIIASLNGTIVKGSKEPLLVKFADGASKKKVHHFQHKPLGGNAFSGDHLWRNNSNDTNYHMMNSGPGNRHFHGNSFDHSRQNHAMPHHSNGLAKQHQQMLSSMSNYHPHHQGSGHHAHSSAHHNQQQQHHQPQLQQHHHGHNHSSHSSHRNQNQGPYSGSNFPLSGSMSGANDASQWLHPPQAGQPYVLQPQMLAPTSAIDPSLHYVNLANQMQGLQIGNPAVSGYLSPQQWPVWPSGVGAKHPGASQSTNHGASHAGYSDAD